jgi:hypothetical protein
MESTGDLSYTLQTVAGCGYSLATFLAFALAIFAAVKLKRSMGAWALALGLGGATLVAVVGDVLIIGEVDSEVMRIVWLAMSMLGLLCGVVMLVGVAMLKPLEPGAG